MNRLIWVIVENRTIRRKKITYSPKKTVKKFKKANSVLNPETNSLSPSKRSKGTLELSHKNTRNKIHKKIKKTLKGKWINLDRMNIVLQVKDKNQI